MMMSLKTQNFKGWDIHLRYTAHAPHPIARTWRWAAQSVDDGRNPSLSPRDAGRDPGTTRGSVRNSKLGIAGPTLEDTQGREPPGRTRYRGPPLFVRLDLACPVPLCSFAATLSSARKTCWSGHPLSLLAATAPSLGGGVAAAAAATPPSSATLSSAAASLLLCASAARIGRKFAHELWVFILAAVGFRPTGFRPMAPALLWAWTVAGLARGPRRRLLCGSCFPLSTCPMPFWPGRFFMFTRHFPLDT